MMDAEDFDFVCPHRICHKRQTADAHTIINLKGEIQRLKAELQSHGPNDRLPGAIWLACWFHDTYESLAPLYGYETKPETRIFDASTPNGKLMIAVCRELRKQLGSDATGSEGSK